MTASSKSLYGIIGYPVTYSLSPVIHNTAFKELGINAEYQLFPLEENILPEFFNQLRDEENNILGLNVTIPYKETVIKYLDSLSPYAKKAMAVNTIVVMPHGKLNGFNTDGPGFLTDLTKNGFNIQNKKIAILGSGGAVRAILSALTLLPKRPQSIKIFNRHRERTQILVKDLGTRLDLKNVQAVESINDLDIPHADLLINATPLGMRKEDESPVSEEFLHKKLFVYDLIYTRPETKLMKLAQKKGARAVNGLGMLFSQGILSFQHWINDELEEKIKNKIWKNLVKAVEKNG